MLGLWYYFWNQADWSQNVTGTGNVRLRGIQCSATGTVSQIRRQQSGGGKPYRSHWHPIWKVYDLPKELPLPVKLPEAVTGTVVCQQAHGEVTAEGTQTLAGRAHNNQRRQQAHVLAEMSTSGLAEVRQRKPNVSAEGDMIDQELEMLLAMILAA